MKIIVVGLMILAIIILFLLGLLIVDEVAKELKRLIK